MENPVQKPYVHQEFPKRLYLEGDKENSIVVEDPDSEEEAEANGYTSTWINPEEVAKAAAAPKAPAKASATKAEKTAAMEAAIGRNAKASRVKMPPPPKAGAEESDEDEGDGE
jgi:hypothetical protein